MKNTYFFSPFLFYFFLFLSFADAPVRSSCERFFMFGGIGGGRGFKSCIYLEIIGGGGSW